MANIILDGQAKLLQSSPGPMTQPIIDRLEQHLRSTGGVSPFYGGQNTGSLRTGKAIDTMGSFSIDPRVEEAQKIMARTLTSLNEGIGAVEKGYYPRRTIVAFTGFQTDDSMVSYVPADVYDTTGVSPIPTSVVDYEMPGASVSEITVEVGQLVGAGMMSKKTGMVKHPFIPDADAEEDKIIEEQIVAAVLGGFVQQAGSGAVPLIDAVAVLREVQNGNDIVKAIETSQAAAQARQAAAAPPPGPDQASSPATQPGLAAPGMGVEAGPPGAAPIPPPAQGIDNLHMMLRALGTGKPPNAPTATVTGR